MLRINVLNRNHYWRHLLVIIFSLSITACGFQLRGKDSRFFLPAHWKKLALISTNPQGDFTRQVKLTFKSAGVEWNSSGSANYILNLGSAELKRFNQSLNPQARSSEIELVLKSSISMTREDGKEIVPKVKMVVRRYINNNPINATSTNEEIQLTISEMQRQLAENMLRRISNLAHSTAEI